jgi:hypothetical protein
MGTQFGAIEFNQRAAVQIENEYIRVTVTKEGGHIAEIFHKATGVNPLWLPPWTSMEPSAYDPGRHPEYGLNSESKLLVGIMGHNLCLDVFGPPSAEEAQAGMTVHGEASVARYEFEVGKGRIDAQATLPLSQLRVHRSIRLKDDGTGIDIVESVENLTALDRPIAWTQHVTLGPPFLERGVTKFSLPATRSRVFEQPGFDADGLAPGVDFEWPLAPSNNGNRKDLSTFTAAPKSSNFTAQLMDPSRDDAWFEAYSPKANLLFGYRWRREDFPWLGIWEENHFRSDAPWNGRTLTCGMEFGVSPFPESRRQMIDRRAMFDTPTYRWLPARAKIAVNYAAFIRQADSTASLNA